MFEPILLQSQVLRQPRDPILLAAPIPCIVVEWPTGVFYGNHSICPCCCPTEAEGFVVPLREDIDLVTHWWDLCNATEEEALALIEKAQEWGMHKVRNLTFHAHPENRYCWHRCSFGLEFWPSSLAFDPVTNGTFVGWLAWPWEERSGYEPRPWG